MSTVPVNDLSICVATPNGSGSASANGLIYKSLFKMGIPCSGKNLFPSNIQGLPTWYLIRANGRGFLARKDEIDVLVAFNEKTIVDDFAQVRSGGVAIYDSSITLPDAAKRDDVMMVGLPATDLVKENIKSPQLRAKQRNMVYVGAVAQLFGIPFEILHEVLEDVLGKKPAVIESNELCIRLGYDYIAEHGFKQNICSLEPIPGGTQGKIMTEGNTAAALGSIFGGVTVVPWYPITPSSSVVESMAATIDQYRTNDDGTRRYVILQAEDELASASMVIGAGWSGARAMTATSGPGLSLMQEGIGLAYFAEVPSVFVIVQRAGPSTGLPTRTQQADITLIHQGSHGDTRHLVLIPHDNESIFEMAWQAFDFADEFQTPTFLMMDLDLGMNHSISNPFRMPDKPFQRGKLLTDEQLAQQGGNFRRYFDLDGDGIPQRTIPGMKNPGAAYFARGSGHDPDARYTENPEIYQAILDRLRKKYETARGKVPKPIIQNGAATKEAMISFGSSYDAALEACDRLASKGRPMNHLLVRALPLTGEVEAFLAKHDKVYLVEQNRDGQMTQIMRDDFPQYAARIQPICLYDGISLSAGRIVNKLEEYPS